MNCNTKYKHAIGNFFLFIQKKKNGDGPQSAINEMSVVMWKKIIKKYIFLSLSR